MMAEQSTDPAFRGRRRPDPARPHPAPLQPSRPEGRAGPRAVDQEVRQTVPLRVNVVGVGLASSLAPTKPKMAVEPLRGASLALAPLSVTCTRVPELVTFAFQKLCTVWRVDGQVKCRVQQLIGESPTLETVTVATNPLPHPLSTR